MKRIFWLIASIVFVFVLITSCKSCKEEQACPYTCRQDTITWKHIGLELKKLSDSRVRATDAINKLPN